MENYNPEISLRSIFALFFCIKLTGVDCWLIISTLIVDGEAISESRDYKGGSEMSCPNYPGANLNAKLNNVEALAASRHNSRRRIR